MNPEQSPELSRERAELPPQIDDLEIYTGASLEDLGEAAVQELLEEARKSSHFERHIRVKYGIGEEAALEPALRTFASGRVDQYRSFIEQRRETAKQQTEDCLRVALERGWLRERKSVKLVLVDDFLNHGLRKLKKHDRFNYFDATTNSSFVDVYGSNRLLTHELGHALSYNPDTRSGGYGRFIVGEDGSLEHDPKSNVWFLEGATVIWEDHGVNDDSTISYRGEEFSLYDWYRDATRLVCEEAGIDEGTLMRGYFGNEESEAEVREKIQKRFGCTLEDLKCLDLKLDIEHTRRVVRGEEVVVEIDPRYEQESEIAAKRKLAEIFPNVKIIEAEHK